MAEQACKAVVTYRVAIQDRKNWRVWRRSQEYQTFDELMAKFTPWLRENQGATVRFESQTRYVLE